jgi:hypothetical protein
MGGGRQGVGLIAEGELDGPEELVVGQVGELGGHPFQGLIEYGAEAVPEVSRVGRRHGRASCDE